MSKCTNNSPLHSPVSPLHSPVKDTATSECRTAILSKHRDGTDHPQTHPHGTLCTQPLMHTVPLCSLSFISSCAHPQTEQVQHLWSHVAPNPTCKALEGQWGWEPGLCRTARLSLLLLCLQRYRDSKTGMARAPRTQGHLGKATTPNTGSNAQVRRRCVQCLTCWHVNIW